MRAHAVRALALYAIVLTVLAAWFVAFRHQPTSARLDTLDVHRINVREGDGTLRLVIASRDAFPGLIFRNVDRPHAARRDSAGMIFLNDEGTENGGLIFGGHKAGGKVSSFGHLSFDQYEQDQVATLEQSEENGRRTGGVTISDRPDASLDLAGFTRIQRLPPAEREVAIARLKASGAFGRRRLFIGKDATRDAVLELHDAEGRPRLRLRVAPAGDADIQFVDAAGKVVRTVQP